MLEFRSRNIFPLLPLCFFFLHFSSIFVPTFTYTLPDQYFINCGSSSSVDVYGKTFVGDENRGRFSLSSGNNGPVQDPRFSGVGLYRSARVFRKRSWYEFDAEQDGTFVVRFHFLPFPSLGNVSDARFSVVASGFSLLSQFTVEKSNSSPYVEEFFIKMAAGKFKVYFVPEGYNSFAFVNAIEFFIAPPGFLPDSATRVTREGSRGDDYKNLLSLPSRVIHRINVGGKNIMPNNDTLLRSWIPDDPYLFNNETAKDSVPYGFRPQYQSPGSTEFDAPEFVYRTAKQMNIDNSRSNLFNMTWRFPVKGGAKHLLRVHFCDIVSVTSNEGLKFYLYVYSQFSVRIWPFDVIPQLASPFYRDYLVDSDDSGFINVSVGPDDTSRVANAFLNGVEIMQLIEDTSSVSDEGGGGGTHLFIIIGSVVGSAIFVVIVILLIVFLCFKRRKLKAVETFDRPLVPLYGGSSYSRTTDKTVLGSPFADLNLGLKLHLSEIQSATKNFDPKLIIGEGGFGKVYKGMLRNGTRVAVKRSEPESGQGVPEFETEIMVLSSIRHNHLVSLVGYCDERDEMILVYEFMEKGTLREHLYSEESREKSTPRSTLSWEQRVRICVGAAKGIHYLHTGSSGVIIHRDIKSTNILLDEYYVAKVADFGLSRSGPPDQTHVSTEVKGSFGYLDPEYFKFLQLTQKSDVYSFGVVLLEVLCARPVVSARDPVSLVEWGMSWIRKEQLEQIVDPLLEGKINPGSLRKFGETVEKCLQEYGADRPNMVDVLWDLEYCLQLHQTVTPQVPYDDSMTDVGVPMPVIQRLPSHSLPSDDDDESHMSFTNTSQVNAGEVFSLLKIDEAR
ncbi:probable receptor-like protein kinase At5g24010 [Henckelia pumila]|uniref:probable receptor-like protein kinase At5g24010 n=1 Tax=Henckelia pumila TaxID=405737 RepID=UPI003C6DEFE1